MSSRRRVGICHSANGANCPTREVGGEVPVVISWDRMGEEILDGGLHAGLECPVRWFCET